MGDYVREMRSGSNSWIIKYEIERVLLPGGLHAHKQSFDTLGACSCDVLRSISSRIQLYLQLLLSIAKMARPDARSPTTTARGPALGHPCSSLFCDNVTLRQLTTKLLCFLSLFMQVVGAASTLRP
jgi:hypothetical protein